MIANLRSFDCLTNSPYQHYRKCMEKCLGKCMENLDTDVMVKVVNYSLL